MIGLLESLNKKNNKLNWRELSFMNKFATKILFSPKLNALWLSFLKFNDLSINCFLVQQFNIKKQKKIVKSSMK